MTLLNAKAPYLKKEASVSSMMRDTLIALAFLLILPVVRYGVRPLVMAGMTLLVCALCEIAWSLLQSRSINASDCSSMVTGLVIVLLMPLNAPMWLPCAAAAFAILVAKKPFGSTGHTPFNPAAAGVAFATLLWPQQMFAYFNPSAHEALPAFADCNVGTVPSPAAVLKNGLKPDILPMDMLWGVFAGPVGTTGILVVCACGLYLFLKRTANWEITACCLLGAALMAALWPRIACIPLTSVKYELMSGSLLFCAVFMLTDPVTSPRTWLGRVIYGFFAGVLIMLFRRYGAYEQGAAFAILIANAAVPHINSLVCGDRRWGEELYEE
ncbi:RnfABCDGE type electron transport complex subunit D [Caproiciproducens galactitolivorans]|uniref:RnfABCDGE type electron transport complex subunit D n=1 Tax=Caproiciproducens galactitolivorans TaxID=642589 RepID=A0ABT4BVQ1_9FIRM|nr:RnfABCDGE type electron transport complex subunit D [Caproiciproducens galactitolivorans]MCY1714980.1 RnfABCDGE type electron transport complex subunit D [Caproiciproducens galactitolivorans]